MLTLRYRTSREDRGRRLDDLLNAWLPEALGAPVSRSAVRRLLLAGQVVVGDRPVRRPGFLLDAGVRVTARIDPARLAGSRDPGLPAVPPLQAIFEDEALIAIAKPAGLQTHAGADRGRADLFSAVRGLLASRTGAAGGHLPYLALHHRLDRETSGLVLFAKVPGANASLAQQFAGRSVSKTYLAIVSAPAEPAAEWVRRNHLALTGTGRASRMAAVNDGGEPAETLFRLRRWRRPVALVEAHPVTGRRHQVRAHLAGSGFPILGDARYGGPVRLEGLAVRRVMLHAARLELAHPLSGAPLSIACDPPEDFRSLARALAVDRGIAPASSAGARPVQARAHARGLTPPRRDR